MEIKKLKGRLGIKLTKEEKEMKEEDGGDKEEGANDILKENMSELDGSMNGTGGEFDDQRKRLEESVRNLQIELRDKNETVLT